MILFRPSVKHRAWWESPLCQLYGCGGWAARLWARHLAPLPHAVPENDRDRLWW
jgi:hypothetical protein